jgi:hypothetical protein
MFKTSFEFGIRQNSNQFLETECSCNSPVLRKTSNVPSYRPDNPMQTFYQNKAKKRNLGLLTSNLDGSCKNSEGEALWSDVTSQQLIA